MSWLLAFSVQHEIEKYGAYIAVACLLGLALLSILHFAQAREVRRLREWAGRSPERDAELEARVTQQADAARRLHAQPVARPVASEDTQVTPPPAPAPVAAPASATNGHPATPPLAVPMGPRPAAAAAAVAAAVGAATATAAEDKSEAAAPAAEPSVPEPDGDDESPAAGETNGNGTGDIAAIPRATPRPAAAPAPAAAPRRPAQPVRAAERSATVPPRRVPPRGGRPAAVPAQPEHSRTRGIVIGVVAGVVVIAAAALAITQLGGGGGGKTVPNTTQPVATSTVPASGSSTTAGPARADTVVAVLNGTTTEGQAASAKTTLEQAGYASSNIPTGNASNQATPASTVYYAPNRRRQAAMVARALKITRIAAVDAETKSLADNSSDPPVKTDVVVILGADRTP